MVLGDTEEQLTAELFHEFSRAEIGREDDHLRSQVERQLDYLAGDEPHSALPLDVQGTAFQMCAIRFFWTVNPVLSGH